MMGTVTSQTNPDSSSNPGCEVVDRVGFSPRKNCCRSFFLPGGRRLRGRGLDGEEQTGKSRDHRESKIGQCKFETFQF